MSGERRILIAGNWKMNGLGGDGRALAGELAARMEASLQPFDMLICPPFTLLSRISDVVSGAGILLGGQDCHTRVSGAHTGDISADMLKDAGCSAVIVGHSERRTDHGETDSLIKAKAEAAHAAGLTAIICIGETEQEKDQGRTLEVNARQIEGALPEGATAENTVVAYEPVWAIGTGRTPRAEEVQEVHAFIRATIAKKCSQEIAQGMRILYGGSMKPANARELLALADVDGGLIGGASLKAEDFWAIGESCL